ncbi:MAG: hypothetical protein E7426_07145 [Ruminococcaceae bacterium]|nr:hypothetical protein [Oscillospiraceae bacterium]
MKEFSTDIFSRFNKQWALVCAGTLERHNAMTISWGELGTLWGKSVATVYVKPVRYTWQFMEESEYFTVSFYPEEYRQALTVMGSVSGRDCDKDAAAGLTPVPAGEGVTYVQAEVTLLCRKIYWQDLDLQRIPADVVRQSYLEEAPHRMYIGEVLDVIRS